jgi:hypothetical protein
MARNYPARKAVKIVLRTPNATSDCCLLQIERHASARKVRSGVAIVFRLFPRRNGVNGAALPVSVTAGSVGFFHPKGLAGEVRPVTWFKVPERSALLPQCQLAVVQECEKCTPIFFPS